MPARQAVIGEYPAAGIKGEDQEPCTSSSNVNQSAQCGTVAGSLSMILHELFSVIHDTDVTYSVDVHVPLSFMPSAVSVPTVTCYLLTGICP